MGAGLFLLVWVWVWMWVFDCVMHRSPIVSLSRLRRDFPNRIANTPIRPLILLAKMLGLYHNSDLWRPPERLSVPQKQAQAQAQDPRLRASWPNVSRLQEKERDQKHRRHYLSRFLGVIDHSLCY
ncbi:hypothetical protein CGRA01v4_00255 [Colletotrichum graminicola]|nr:hypothetical protein CGRA01v4_00255 [Colletotrichum graminicola]